MKILWHCDMKILWHSVSVPLCGESTGYQYIGLKTTSNACVDVFLDVSHDTRLNKQSRCRRFEDVRMLLWYHCYKWDTHPTHGIYSMSGKTSYRRISWSLEAVRLTVIITILWNLTVTSAALLPTCLSNSRAIGNAEPGSRGSEISPDLPVRRSVSGVTSLPVIIW